MKKIKLYSYDDINSMNEEDLKDYIDMLEQYIYYQSGVIYQSYKLLFDEELEDTIERK